MRGKRPLPDGTGELLKFIADYVQDTNTVIREMKMEVKRLRSAIENLGKLDSQNTLKQS